MATDLFSDDSVRYAIARPVYPTELYEFLLSYTKRRERVWDCGTGNGQAAIALTQWFEQVCATDLSQQQIAQATPAANIVYSVQPAEATSFPNAYFDAVVVAQALHWFDRPRFWAEVQRVLRPGGVFAAWGYDWCQITPELDHCIQVYLRDVIYPYWSHQVQCLWNGYQDSQMPFEAIACPHLSLSMQWNLSELVNYVRTWSATRQCLEATGTAWFSEFRDRLQHEWGDPTEKRSVTMALHLQMGQYL